MTIGDEVWEASLKAIHTCSINTRHQLIQFKVIHRLHYSCTKLHSFYATVSPICPKCKYAEGTLGHLFWSGPKINKFWSDIFKCLSEVHNRVIVPDPFIAILGTTRLPSTLTLLQQKAIQYCVVIAKRNILTLWKKEEVPTFGAWLAEVTNLLHLERIRYTTSFHSVTFDRIWQPFLSYLSRAD